jgi:hypothetical protein
MHLSRDYNFFPGMHGNRLSYHQMLKAAALQMTHIYAVDCEVEFSGVDPAQPKTQTASGGSHISGMIARNDFMADRIASRMKKGKSIAIVGGYHLTDFSEDGQTVLSLQSLMAQKYGVKAATVRFADYLGNLQTEIPALEQHFPQAEAAFEANKFFIIDNAESGTGLPQHIVVFPHDQILENYKIYGEKDDPNPSYRFTREKRYWNKVCLMSGCLSLAI